MKIHFIAIGGAAMHNLALALYSKGYTITGSDDEIFEPSRSKLANKGLLPQKFGWFPDKITADTDAVILGMHAQTNNPELERARKLELNIYSYPEFLYEQTKHKTRIVIGGSHGKTTITSMAMHVFKKCGIVFDYMVGAQIEGFDTMVSLTENSSLAIFEGDEYLSSPIDPRPKFHLYRPHIALINGISWDHINVFPTFEIYLEQFAVFIEKIKPHGKLFYNSIDANTLILINKNKRKDIQCSGYSALKHKIKDGITRLVIDNDMEIPLNVFGEHNMQNMSGAKTICNAVGISDNDFYSAIKTFKGSAKRLQCFYADNKKTMFLDFAHAPSKVNGAVKAVKKQFPDKEIIACLELHTFSSLNKNFINEYKDTLNGVDKAMIFFNPEVIKHKNLPEIDSNDIKAAFNNKYLYVVDSVEQFTNRLAQFRTLKEQVYLFMSSGNFGGLTTDKLTAVILR